MMLKSRGQRLAGVAILLVACCSGLALAEDRSLLEQVCKPIKPSEAPIFSSPAQVRKLIEDQRASQDGTCESSFNEAFSELGALLDPEQLKDICSTQMYQLIRSYHSKFIHFYLPESMRDQLNEAIAKKQIGAPIPLALRNFFILFAKQINAACKEHLVVSLKNDWLGADSPVREDFAVLERYKEDKSRLDFMYEFTKRGMNNFGRNKANEFNQLQIIDFLGARIADSTLQEGDKLFIQVEFDDRLKRIKDACQKRFMPVYMELFAPVIHLNNLGYIDRASSAEEDLELNENKSIRRWYLAVQACEVLKDVEVLHDSSSLSALVGMIKKDSHLHAQTVNKIKILTPAEALKMREKAKNSTDHVSSVYDPDLLEVPHQPVKFTPRMWLQAKEAKREINYFQEDIDHYVQERTSKFKEWKENTQMVIKRFLHKHKNQIIDKDQNSALGQLTIFFERHRLAATLVSLAINVIMFTLIFSGVISFAG